MHFVIGPKTVTARWEREAEATGRLRGSVGYWDDAWLWIERERSAQA